MSALNECPQIAKVSGIKGTGVEKSLGSTAAPQSSPNSSQWLRVRVSDLKTGRPRVNVSIPIGLVDWGWKMGAKFAPSEVGRLDLDLIRAVINANGQGHVVDVEDEEEGKHVEVFVE